MADRENVAKFRQSTIMNSLLMQRIYRLSMKPICSPRRGIERGKRASIESPCSGGYLLQMCEICKVGAFKYRGASNVVEFDRGGSCR